MNMLNRKQGKLFLLILILLFIFPLMVNFHSPYFYLLFAFGIFVVTALVLEYQKKKVTRSFYLAIEEGFSEEISDYRVTASNYKRKCLADRRYRRRFKQALFDFYGNKCAHCERDEVELDLDHFIFPKSRGGNLLMRHRDGYWVNNALPLCKACNRRKADHDFRDVFENGKIRPILELNKEFTMLVNQKLEGIRPFF